MRPLNNLLTHVCTAPKRNLQQTKFVSNWHSGVSQANYEVISKLSSKFDARPTFGIAEC